jgi:hypothetical protein
MIKIAVINESSAITDSEIQAMLPAFSKQWNDHLLRIWGVEEAEFRFARKGRKPAAGTWWVVFLDDSDEADALAYHDLTNEGLPISKVFVKSLIADKASISVGATHEICEMAVDPWLNAAYQDYHGAFWAGEVCDPVEDDRYGYKIGNVLVTDFVTPNWFGHEHRQAAIDFNDRASRAFEVLSGGYAQKFESGKGWHQINGDRAAKQRRVVNPQPGSRRERRRRLAGQPGRRSAVVWKRK